MASFLPSFSTRSPSLGIDIGSRTVKAILASEAPGHIDIQAAGSLTLDRDLVSSGRVLNPRQVGKVIANSLEKMGCSGSNAVMSVPSSLATLRWVTMPPLPPAELRDAAKYKVRRHLPFPVESAYIEASAPDTDGEAGQSLVIAIPRDVIDSRAEALEFAGLTPVAAELEAQAILRVVERRLNEQSALWRDATLTIIDVGASFTHMYVVQNQQLQFIRGVKFGSDRLSESIAKRLEISTDDAEDFFTHPETALTDLGVLHLRTGDLVAQLDIAPEFEKLTREFLRLLRYFRSLHPERSYAGILDHVLVCGGLVGLQGFTDYLAKALGLRVELARPFSGMVAKLNQDTFDNIACRQEAFTVAIGLALSGLKRDVRQTGETVARNEFIWARSA